MVMPPYTVVSWGHFTRFPGPGNYPQPGGTRPGVETADLFNHTGSISLRPVVSILCVLILLSIYHIFCVQCLQSLHGYTLQYHLPTCRIYNLSDNSKLVDVP